MSTPRMLVTGGAGFIGSHFVRRQILAGVEVTNLDALTYAGDPSRLLDVEGSDGYRFVHGDVADRDAVAAALAESRADVVVHFAAESHVTRSEHDPDVFWRTNVQGTRVLLEEAARAGVRRFVHISTDEVYGPITEGAFREEDKPAGEGSATSAYARSKAIADDVARGFDGPLEVCVVRPTNAFGPWQHPEKAFPRWATRGLRGEPLLVWGDGLYVRQWLYAPDLADAVALIAESGEPGGVYNVGPRHEPEITNVALVRWLLERLELPEERLVFTAYDRPDHDRRYAVDASRAEAIGWRAGDVWEQLDATLAWYRDNAWWWERHVAGAEAIYADAPAGEATAPAR